MLPRGLLKEHHQILSFILRLLDVIAIICAGVGAYYYRFGHLNVSKYYLAALFIGAICTFLIFPFFHIYESGRAKSFWQNIKNLVKAIVSTLLVLAGIAFLTKTGENFSRIWFLYSTVFSLILLVFFRSVLLISLRLMRSKGWNERRIIIVGESKLNAKIIKTVQQAVWTGLRIVTVFEDCLKNQAQILNVKVLPIPEDLGAYLANIKESIDEVWITLPLTEERKIKELLYQCRHYTMPIRYVLNIFGSDYFNHSITELAGFPALNLNSSPMVGVNRLIKAIEDRTLAFLILALISPLLLLIAVLVKFSSQGPILFKQKRHGWDGRIIRVYKFRTMYQHQEECDLVTQATIYDARITPLGRWLRRTSLDELPQFFNVLQGRMSIVGPRPHAISHNEFYKDSIEAYMQRHKVKPGITGWAQVNGWRGETETLEKMQKRVEFDLFYIENWSLIFDLKILFLTLFRGFVNKNAY